MKVNEENLSYYLVDAAHPLSRVWYMSQTKLKETEVTCFLTKMTELEGAEVTLLRNKKDARLSKNDVLFYADPKFASSLGDTSTLTIRLDQLEKIEVCELNQVKTFGTPLISFTGLLLLLYVITSGL